MARFTFDPVPSVAPTGAPGGDYENISASPEMFGGLTAQALQTAGQGVEHAAEAGFNVLAFQDKINADDQTNHFIKSRDSLLYGDPSKSTTGADGKPVPDLGYLGLTGRDASDRREDTLKALEDARLTGRNNLKSSRAQLEYDTQTRRMYADAEARMSSHAEQQWKGWAGDVNQTRANLSLNAFVRNLDTPQAGIDGQDYIRFREQQAQVKYGNDPAILEGVRSDAHRDLLKAETDAIAVKDPARAIKILEQHKDIAGTQYDDMYNRLRGRANQQTGNDVASESIAKSRGGTLAPTTSASIQGVAARYGINPNDLGRAVQIESGGNPRAQTGSYKGLLQLSQAEFDKYKTRPDANIWNAQDNLEAGAAKMKAEGAVFERNFGHAPTGFDAYMIHQQGLAGYSAHLANPNAPAWQNMLSTGEGRQKGEGWARAAIWGNIPNQYKATFGNVDNVTSRDFIAMWQAKYGQGAGPSAPLQAANENNGGALMPVPRPASFQVEPAFNESRGNVEAASFPPQNMAAAIRPAAMQHVLDDPRAQDPEVRRIAAERVEQELRREAIAEDQKAATKKGVNDEAAGKYTTQIGDMQNSSKPDWVGIDNAINHDPNLDFRTKHELRQWVSDASGGRIERSFGPGFWDAYKQVHAPPGDPGRITDISQLYGMVRPGGPLTVAGIDKLGAEIEAKKTPAGEAESEAKKEFFKNARSHITFENEELKIPDPGGKQRFLNFFIAANEAYDQGKKNGKTMGQLLNSNSPDYIGKLIEAYKPTAGEAFADRIQDKPAEPGFFARMFGAANPPAPFDAGKVTSGADLAKAYRDGRISREEAARILIERGWARRPEALPQVPISQ